MADKYLYNNAGTITEREATVVSAGAGNAGDIVALDASGRLDQSVMPEGLLPDTASIVASENLVAGDFVNVWNDAGTPKVRKADASNNRPAVGFVKDAVTSGNNASVYFEGTNDDLTGLTIGATYFLSASTPGEAVSVAPTGSGEIVQILGRAIAATKISFEPSEAIVLA